MDFGKQVDEHETSEIANNIQQIVTQQVTNTNDESATPQPTTNQTEDTNDVAPSSQDFSNLTADAGDNPYKRRPSPTESPSIPPESLATVVGYNPRKTANYNSQPNPKPNAAPDLTLRLRLRRKDIIRCPNRTGLTFFNYRHTTA